MGTLMEASKGRRLLWLDYTDYAGSLFGDGKPPFLDTAACVAWYRKAQGLLQSDVVALPVGALFEDWLLAHPTTLEVMRGKSRRAAGPLRELLAAPAMREHLIDLVKGLRAAFSKSLVILTVPSPPDWIDRAFSLATPGPVAAIDADSVDSAASNVADFLRIFAAHGIDAVLMEQTSAAWRDMTSVWALYEPILNVSQHYGWDIGLRVSGCASPIGSCTLPCFIIAPDVVDVVNAGIEVPATFWRGMDVIVPNLGQFDFAEIPHDVQPEFVLQRLSELRQRGTSW